MSGLQTHGLFDFGVLDPTPVNRAFDLIPPKCWQIAYREALESARDQRIPADERAHNLEQSMRRFLRTDDLFEWAREKVVAHVGLPIGTPCQSFILTDGSVSEYFESPGRGKFVESLRVWALPDGGFRGQAIIAEGDFDESIPHSHPGNTVFFSSAKTAAA